jgi:hypothetical protein
MEFDGKKLLSIGVFDGVPGMRVGEAVGTVRR